MRKIKRLDLLLNEVKDPHSQENFWRLRQYIDNIDQAGIPGPQGATGMMGPAGPSGGNIVLNTNISTIATDFLYVTGANFVSKVTDNSVGIIPHGIFGVAASKPTATTVESVALGVVAGFAGLITGSAIFVSVTGGIAYAPPATGMVQRIGWALSPTEIFVQLTQPLRRS